MELRVTTGRRSRRAGHDQGYTPVPHPLGHELRGIGEGWHLVAFLAIFVVVFGGVTTIVFVVAMGDGGPPAWYFVVAGGLVVALLAWTLRRIVRVRRAWEPSRLILDEWPLLIGGSASAWFTRPRERDTSTPQPSTARLVLRESATYRVGTDTRVATEDVLDVPLTLTPRTFDGIDGFATTLTIPDEGPPTIQLDSNLVEWLVIVDLEAPGAPAVTSTFTVLVAPRRAA